MNKFYYSLLICFLFSTLLCTFSLRISEKKTLSADEKPAASHAELEDTDEVAAVLEKLEKGESDNEVTEDHFFSALQEMDTSHAYQAVFDGIHNVFAQVAYDRLTVNPDEEYNHELMAKELTSAGYGAFLQGEGKAMFGKWLKDKWNKVKDMGKKAVNQLKGIATKTGFLTKIKTLLKETALPKAKELFKKMTAQELPAIEQIIADSVKSLSPSIRKVALQTLLPLFNKLEKYLGVHVDDNIFVADIEGGKRLRPELETEADDESDNIEETSDDNDDDYDNEQDDDDEDSFIESSKKVVKKNAKSDCSKKNDKNAAAKKIKANKIKANKNKANENKANKSKANKSKANKSKANKSKANKSKANRSKANNNKRKINKTKNMENDAPQDVKEDWKDALHEMQSTE